MQRLANAVSILGDKASTLHPLAETYLEYLDLESQKEEILLVLRI